MDFVGVGLFASRHRGSAAAAGSAVGDDGDEAQAAVRGEGGREGGRRCGGRGGGG